MKRILITFAIIALLLPAVAQAQVASGGTGAEGKLAYINTSRLVDGIPEMKEKMDALKAEFDPKLKEVEALDEEVKNLKNRIQTQGDSVSEQVRKQWLEELTEKERKFQRLGEEYTAQGQRRHAEVTEPIMAKISKFLEKYCKQHGIVMVLEGTAVQKAGLLLFASPASDITEDFIAQYNKDNR